MQKIVVNRARVQPLTPALSEAKIKILQANFSANPKVEKTLNLMEIISGETRLKILYLLAKENFLSVSDIAHILKSQPSGISHQLAILRSSHMVRAKKKERIVLYSLEARLPKLVEAAISLD